MKKNTSNYLWGSILILIGFLLAGRALNWFDFNIFFDGWWSLFIIVPCFIGLFRNEGEKTSNLIGLCIGVFLLLAAQSFIQWRMFWPLCLAAILVVVGFKMLLPSREKKKDYKDYRDSNYQNYSNYNYSSQNDNQQSSQSSEQKEQQGSTSNGYSYTYTSQTDGSTNQNNTNNGYQNAYQNARQNGAPFACTAIFGGRELRFDNEVFTGAVLSAVLGGIEIDLRNAIIRENVVIEAKAVLGGIDIFVPNYVRVVVNCSPILGGVDNKTITPVGANEQTITIYLNATCVLGGIDVK